MSGRPLRLPVLVNGAPALAELAPEGVDGLRAAGCALDDRATEKADELVSGASIRRPLEPIRRADDPDEHRDHPA